jgi:hypothetical protein
VAALLKVPTDAIKNFDEDSAVNIISKTFTDFKDNAIANANHCTFNPINKIVELYEALVKSEKEKNELLQKLLDQKK